MVIYIHTKYTKSEVYLFLNLPAIFKIMPGSHARCGAVTQYGQTRSNATQLIFWTSV